MTHLKETEMTLDKTIQLTLEAPKAVNLTAADF